MGETRSPACSDDLLIAEQLLDRRIMRAARDDGRGVTLSIVASRRGRAPAELDGNHVRVGPAASE